MREEKKKVTSAAVDLNSSSKDSGMFLLGVFLDLHCAEGVLSSF